MRGLYPRITLVLALAWALYGWSVAGNYVVSLVTGMLLVLSSAANEAHRANLSGRQFAYGRCVAVALPGVGAALAADLVKDERSSLPAAAVASVLALIALGVRGRPKAGEFRGLGWCGMAIAQVGWVSLATCGVEAALGVLPVAVGLWACLRVLRKSEAEERRHAGPIVAWVALALAGLVVASALTMAVVDGSASIEPSVESRGTLGWLLIATVPLYAGIYAVGLRFPSSAEPVSSRFSLRGPRK